MCKALQGTQLINHINPLVFEVRTSEVVDTHKENAYDYDAHHQCQHNAIRTLRGASRVA